MISAWPGRCSEDAITLEIGLDRPVVCSRLRNHRPRWYLGVTRWTFGVTAAGAAAVAAVLILQVFPTSKGTSPEAAAAEIADLPTSSHARFLLVLGRVVSVPGPRSSVRHCEQWCFITWRHADIPR